MTVRELIDRLSKLDPELPVMVDGYESGLDKATMVRVVTAEKDEDPGSYCGEFDHEETGFPVAYIGDGGNLRSELLEAEQP